MAEKDDIPYIVPPSQYDPELEKEVRRYLDEVVPLPFNDTLYERTPKPKFKNAYEKELWEREEIRRCRNGYKGLCGKMYFYFNYGWIQKIEGGRIQPEFRVVDHEWFKFVEECQESKGWGIVCIKRRRVGASWKEAADMLHDIIFTPHVHVGMNSKTETDTAELFRKVHFMFDHLPGFLRPKIGSGKRDMLELARKGKYKGHQSYIAGRAPTVSAFEGFMLNKWVCDEAGKIDNLLQMFAFTEDTMMDEYRRTGMPIVFGTVGEVDGKGGGIFELWENAEAYKLKKFFFKGWMGLFVDKKGNDRVEESIRYIVYERINQEKRGKKFYTDFLQRYPLNEEDAFALATDGGLGDPAKLNHQRNNLLVNPPIIKTGYYDFAHLEETGEPLFIPAKDGPVRIYESPQDLQDGYAAGCDPVEAIEDALPGASLLSFMIRRRPYGTAPGTLALQITYRPRDVSDFYRQVICALADYKTRVLIERNRYDMIGWFNRNGHKHLLHQAPTGIMRLTGGRVNQIGVQMTEPVKKYMEGLIEAELAHGTEQVPDLDLLREFAQYGSRNTDRVMAFGLALMLEAEMMKPAKQRGEGGNRFAALNLVKDKDGNLRRVRRSIKQQSQSTKPDFLKGKGPGSYVID